MIIVVSNYKSFISFMYFVPCLFLYFCFYLAGIITYFYPFIEDSCHHRKLSVGN